MSAACDRAFAWTVIAVVTVIGCSASSLPPPPVMTVAPSAPVVATVIAAAGDVRVRRNSTGAWTPLGSNTEIGPDDTVQSLGNGSATLRVATTNAELVLQPNTTMRFDGTSRPRAMAGRIIAKIGDATQPMRFELALPPGLLVLTTDPATQKVAEASIEVAAEGTTLEMRRGSGRIVPPAGPPIVVAEHGRARFDVRGQVLESPASSTELVRLVEPRDGARLRVRQSVVLSWAPIAGSDGYRISIDSGPIVRQLDVTAASAAVPIASGHYRWTVQPVHGGVPALAAARRTFDVEVDNRPPELAIDAPSPGASVTGPQIRITGHTKPGAAIEVARAHATADTSGNFAILVPIARGLSNLVVMARDDLGNQRRVARSVVWE